MARKKVAPPRKQAPLTVLGHPPRPAGITEAAAELAERYGSAQVAAGYGLGAVPRGEPSWRIYVFADGEVQLPPAHGGFEVVRRAGLRT